MECTRGLNKYNNQQPLKLKKPGNILNGIEIVRTFLLKKVISTESLKRGRRIQYPGPRAYKAGY
jgi:hypothetical protein